MRQHPVYRSVIALAVPFALHLAVLVSTAAPVVAASWPKSSKLAVEPLAHPGLENRVEERAAAGLSDTPWRFAAFGDQRALANGEWQSLIAWIRDLDREREIDFVVDTGDIVDDGRHSDQFARLSEILAPIRHRPYLVGVGNHELDNNRSAAAREHTVRFLAPLDPAISEDCLYYRKDVGPFSFLFLDTNDFAYGTDGHRNACPLEVDPSTREGAQILWLREQVADLAANPPPIAIAVLHHPIVQSSAKHREAACALWNFQDRGEGIADILADGGIDLILVGHTHTYERFRMERNDGQVIHVVNLSGRPRDSFLWFGSGDRRVRDIRQKEVPWLEEMGWMGLDHWKITQEDLMLKREEADQFALFEATADGGLSMQVHFLDEKRRGTAREVVRLK